MVVANLAVFSDREWLDHAEFHVDPLYLHKVVFEWDQNEKSPYGEISQYLKKWKIKFKEHYYYVRSYSSWYDGPNVFALFFRNKSPVLRLKLIFGEKMKSYIVCRPRQQLEAIRRKELKAKKQSMKKPSQTHIYFVENELDKSKLRAKLNHDKNDGKTKPMIKKLLEEYDD
jgi:hypothetical protein